MYAQAEIFYFSTKQMLKRKGNVCATVMLKLFRLKKKRVHSVGLARSPERWHPHGMKTIWIAKEITVLPHLFSWIFSTVFCTTGLKIPIFFCFKLKQKQWRQFYCWLNFMCVISSTKTSIAMFILFFGEFTRRHGFCVCVLFPRRSFHALK